MASPTLTATIRTVPASARGTGNFPVTSTFPVARTVADQAISLPVHPHLTETDLDTIVETVREVLGA